MEAGLAVTGHLRLGQPQSSPLFPVFSRLHWANLKKKRGWVWVGQSLRVCLWLRS